MPAPATEKELAAAIAAAVAPATFYWGWAPAEGAERPPTLPLVVLNRTTALTGPYEDQCKGAEILTETSCSLHVWAKHYEEARTLQASARAAAHAMRGWFLVSESDQYDGEFGGWVIVSDWTAGPLALV